MNRAIERKNEKRIENRSPFGRRESKVRLGQLDSVHNTYDEPLHIALRRRSECKISPTLQRVPTVTEIFGQKRMSLP